jgi:hypothetical protein
MDDAWVLESSLDKLDLDYHGHGQSLFSRGQIRRTCEVSISGRVLDPAGKLLRSANIPSCLVVDTIDYQAAMEARRDSGAFAPAMPSTFAQRVVEPAIIIGITGALVYLFFASR